ncbi:dihydropteroate synthase [Candidatus Neomarinimicrobiota bacterium]
MSDSIIREIIIHSPDELAQEFSSINVDPDGIGIMAPKAFLHILRLRELKSPAANILKQEMLSAGGECATSRSVILGDPEPQDAILIGTRRQLTNLSSKIKSQPFGLRRAAKGIDDFLRQVGISGAGPHPMLQMLDGETGHYPLIMGILNVTPDSFSDGDHFLDGDDAIRHGLKMLNQGAEVIDVGGESTRPGSDPVAEDEELRRVLPVIAGLREETERPISIDTMKSGVAKEALQAGATLVNDVSAGRHDPHIMEVVAETGCPYVLMHMQGMPKTMQENPHYDNLLDEMHRFFNERIKSAVEAGIAEENIILDPGIGFGKRKSDNYEILRRLGEFRIFGHPIMVGVSRKSLLMNELGATPQERLEETIAAGTIAMANGADIIRVHDIIPALKSRTIIQRVLGRS